MEEVQDKEKVQKVNEFNRVIDATSEFLKAIFPHGLNFVKTIKDKSKKQEIDKISNSK